MNFKKFGNFNWIEMDSKDRNLDLTRTKQIYFYPFQSIFVYWGFSRGLHYWISLFSFALIARNSVNFVELWSRSGYHESDTKVTNIL